VLVLLLLQKTPNNFQLWFHFRQVSLVLRNSYRSRAMGPQLKKETRRQNRAKTNARARTNRAQLARLADRQRWVGERRSRVARQWRGHAVGIPARPPEWAQSDAARRRQGRTK
jgi:hypothetical protein